jgi:ABC-2 type transport system permease protein
MNAIVNIANRELGRIASSKIYIFLLFILPVTLFAFLAYIFTTGVVRDIPVAICNSDNGELSRTFTSMVESTGSMKIAKYVASETELREEFLNGNIYAGFYIPSGFEADIKSGKGSSVIVYNNTTNLITGNTVLKDATTFIKTFSAGVLMKKIRSKGMAELQAMDIVNPVKLDTRPLYNPNYNYLNYLVPGLIPVMFQMIIMLLSAILISSEFSGNSLQSLFEAAGNKVYAVIIGKSIPHLMIYLSTVFLILGIVYPFFKIEVTGSILYVFLFFILFILACFFYGLMISCFSKNYLQTTEISLFLNTPAFIFSGFIYPLWAMPAPHTWFAQLMPFTHFIDGYLKLGVMGTSLTSAMPQIMGLVGFVVIPFIVIYVFMLIHKKKILSDTEGEYIIDNQEAVDV